MSGDPLSGCPDTAPGRAGAAVPSWPPGMGTRGVREQLRGSSARATESKRHSQVGMWEVLDVPGRAVARGAGGERG